MKTIRNISLGWMSILLSLGFVLSGSSMILREGGKTLLCFEEGCRNIQGISNIALGVFAAVMGVYMILRNRKIRKS